MSKPDSSPVLLLVEGNEGHAYLIENALRGGRGFARVHRVRTCREAIDFLSCSGGCPDGAGDKNNPLLVILDLELPDGDGKEVLHHMRSIPHLRPVPVFIITAFATPENIHLCHELGCDACLSKWEVFIDLNSFVRKVNWITAVVHLPDAISSENIEALADPP